MISRSGPGRACTSGSVPPLTPAGGLMPGAARRSAISEPTRVASSEPTLARGDEVGEHDLDERHQPAGAPAPS